jgi:glutaredoxin
MGVYSFLVVMMALSARKYFLMVIPVIASIIIALSLLSMPKSEAFVTKDGNYLIQSPTCKHCKKVKAYLKENNIEFTKLDIDDIEARNFATFLDFKTIPILITKEGKNIKIINGDSNIISSFAKPEVVMEEAVVAEESIMVEESLSVGSSSSDLLYEDEDANEGCGFASLDKVEEESDCSKE